MLTEGLISKPLLSYLQAQNETVQTDPQAAMQKFCNEIEAIVFNAIKSATVIIQPAAIQVTGANSGGPVQSENISPITLNQVIE